MYKLDRTKSKELQISNDAFFYMTAGEEMLDESNMEEAQEIAEMFPDGFDVEGEPKMVDGTDLVEVVLVPYVKDDDNYDLYLPLTTEITLQVQWLDNKTKVRQWWYDSKTGTRELRGDSRVEINKYGLECFISPMGSTYFLKHFKPKK